MSLFGSTCLLADQQVMAPDPTGQTIKSILLMVGFMIIMWLLIFAPQRKRAKELEALLKALKPGDRVVTSSGILGVVLAIKDKTVSIRSADTKLELLKSSISDVTGRDGDPAESKS